MKFAIFTLLLLSACASHKPLDRTESQKEYEREEAVNQQKSMSRSELMAKIKAIDSQIASTDSQIKTQKNVIRQWQGKEEVASSRAMIDNANVRIRHLKAERDALANQRAKAQAELDAI